MNVTDIHSVYFVGIGGIGMSAIARYFHKKDIEVSGFDKTETPLTKAMEREGIKIHYKENEGRIPTQVDLVVYTPAIAEDNIELAYCRRQGFTVRKRSEVLAAITAQSKTIAVAGTHGKTSITSLVSHLLQANKVQTTAFVGGIMKNYNSNLIVSEAEEEFTVVEADEYDRSFHFLRPEIGLISSTDADHLDIYQDSDKMLESFQQFADNVSANGTLIVKKGLNISRKAGLKTLTYSMDEMADYYCTGWAVDKGKFVFDVQWSGNQLRNITLPIGGKHNIENAVAAIALADQAGLNREQMLQALKEYKGVRRRFEVVFQNQDCVYIDDYAHHPTELHSMISSVKQMFPGKPVTGIFQPHLYSRTRDFVAEFAKTLDGLDEIMLLDIYPAREKPIPGITSRSILDKMENPNKKLTQKTNLFTKIEKNHYPVLLTLGAGDIDKMVEPIASILNRKYAS